jgi:hypothetical protein
MDRADKILALASFVVGQIPVIFQALERPLDFLSIYQPLIYQGKEFYLALPVMVGLFATWFVFSYGRWAMWTLLVVFLSLSAVVAWLWNWPATDPIHAFNWALWYCCLALIAAVITRIIDDVWHSRRPPAGDARSTAESRETAARPPLHIR